MKFSRGVKNILSHHSRGGLTKLSISKIIPWEMNDGSGPQHLNICACDTNMELNIHHCRIKFVVKGID